MCSPCSHISDVWSIKRFWTTCNFSLETLCPFKATRSNRRMLSFCEETWEGKQRSKSSTYCDKVEPLRKVISCKSAFKICWNQEGLSVKPWGITLQVSCLPFQVKAKGYWLASPTGMVKNVQFKSITVKNLVPVGIDASSVGGLGTTGCQGIIMLFIASRSWANVHPCLFSFLTGKMGVLQRRVQGIIMPWLM